MKRSNLRGFTPLEIARPKTLLVRKARVQFLTGFTLLEVLIYLALFAFIISGALVGVYQIIDSTDKISAKIFVEQEGNFLLRKIDWALIGASSSTVSALGLSIIRPDLPGQSPLLFSTSTDASGLHLQLARGSVATSTLNSDNIAITDLQFTQLSSPDGVTASFKINGRQFETTKYLR
jgi:type II secretory pathway pseudopilin PulG